MSQLPQNHDERLRRARLSLEGLSVADSLGAFFEFSSPDRIPFLVKTKTVPSPPWYWTDDTNMALSIYEILRKHGEIDQGELADSFATHFDRQRGYGMGARMLITQIKAGLGWRNQSASLFSGSGSFGNGSGMRIPPLGAYFADDIPKVVEQARLASEITHMNPEGIAGGIAIAVATAIAWQTRGESISRQAFIAQILPHIPDGDVKVNIQQAHDLPDGMPVVDVVNAIGNGSQISSPDTMPFVLWSAGEKLDDYENAIWQTMEGGGDVDTTCAMVGGIVAARAGEGGVSQEWHDNREPLPDWAFNDVT